MLHIYRNRADLCSIRIMQFIDQYNVQFVMICKFKCTIAIFNEIDVHIPEFTLCKSLKQKHDSQVSADL